jgi:hypothetical protein
MGCCLRSDSQLNKNSCINIDSYREFNQNKEINIESENKGEVEKVTIQSILTSDLSQFKRNKRRKTYEITRNNTYTTYSDYVNDLESNMTIEIEGRKSIFSSKSTNSLFETADLKEKKIEAAKFLEKRKVKNLQKLNTASDLFINKPRSISTITKYKHLLC